MHVSSYSHVLFSAIQEQRNHFRQAWEIAGANLRLLGGEMLLVLK